MTFSNGTRIVYKPRSMEVEQLICGNEGSIFSKFKKEGLNTYAVYNTKTQDYGYAEFVESNGTALTMEPKEHPSSLKLYTARDSKIGSGDVGQPLNLCPPSIAKLFKFSCFSTGCAWHKFRAPPSHIPIFESLSVYADRFILVDQISRQLGLSDLHMENIITRRGAPLLIDAEVAMAPTDGMARFYQTLVAGARTWGFEITADPRTLKRLFVSDMENNDVSVFYQNPNTGHLYYNGEIIGRRRREQEGEADAPVSEVSPTKPVKKESVTEAPISQTSSTEQPLKRISADPPSYSIGLSHTFDTIEVGPPLTVPFLRKDSF